MVGTETSDTIADGLATRIPVKDKVIEIRELVVDVRLVTEEQALKATAHLLMKEGRQGRTGGCGYDGCLASGFNCGIVRPDGATRHWLQYFRAGSARPIKAGR
jgi:hypothetical protein